MWEKPPSVLLESGNVATPAESAAATITYTAIGQTATTPDGVQPLVQGGPAQTPPVFAHAIQRIFATSVGASTAPDTLPTLQIKQGSTVVFSAPLVQLTADAPFIYQLDIDFPGLVRIAPGLAMVVTMAALTNAQHTLCVLGHSVVNGVR